MRMRGNMQVVGVFAVLLCLFSTASAQKVGGAGGSVKQPGAATGGGSTPTRTTKAPVKTVVRTVEKRVTPTTGSLSVGAESNATLLVEPLNVRKGQAQQGVVPA